MSESSDKEDIFWTLERVKSLIVEDLPAENNNGSRDARTRLDSNESRKPPETSDPNDNNTLSDKTELNKDIYKDLNG